MVQICTDAIYLFPGFVIFVPMTWGCYKGLGAQGRGEKMIKHVRYINGLLNPHKLGYGAPVTMVIYVIYIYSHILTMEILGILISFNII